MSGLLTPCSRDGCTGQLASWRKACPLCGTPVPPPPPPKRRRGQPEAVLSQKIQAYLTLAGYHVTTTEQGYRRSPGGTRMTPGIPDLYIRGHGFREWVELKTTKGRLRASQKEWADIEAANGGRVLVWRTLTDAQEWHEANMGGLHALKRLAG